MSSIEKLLVWLYIHMLRLYPQEFYENFADEMQDTFATRLAERSRATLWLGLREIVSLLFSIEKENRRQALRDNTIALWQMIVILMLPVIAGSTLMLLRNVHIFFLPGKTWDLFASMTLIFIGIGILSKGRLLLLALPILGFMVSIGERLIWQIVPLYAMYGIPNYVQYIFLPIILAIVLLIYTLKQKEVSYSWVFYLLALPVTGLITGTLVIVTTGALDQTLNAWQLFQSYYAGTLFAGSIMSLLFLIGLPFAYRYGSKAVVLMIGYLFAELVGLSASLPTSNLQRMMGIIYIVLFLGLIPLLYLRAKPYRFERATLMIPIVLSYGLLFAVQTFVPVPYPPNMSFSAPFDPTFMIYRTGEMLQILIMLALAIAFYRPLKRIRKKHEMSEPEPMTNDTMQAVSV